MLAAIYIGLLVERLIRDEPLAGPERDAFIDMRRLSAGGDGPALRLSVMPELQSTSSTRRSTLPGSRAPTPIASIRLSRANAGAPVTNRM